MRTVTTAAVLALLGVSGLSAQAGQDCRLELLGAARGNRVEVIPGVVNEFLGGNVRFRCVGLEVFMRADSVASYQGKVVQFIGAVRYRDSSVTMTADNGTWLTDQEKWEARGNVVLTNLQEGSDLRGPVLDYWREIPVRRPVSEMFADRRPTVTLPVKDSTGGEQEPYVVTGDRIRMRGNDQVFAGGRVAIDRSDFLGRSDSLFLDTGEGNEGALIGGASLRRTASDSFNLVGRRIDLVLAGRELEYVTARDSASLTTAELELVGDGIGLDVAGETVEQTLAWGSEVRPVALAEAFEARGDSLAFDTPGQRLREVRAFGGAWMATSPDSAGDERDWVSGDTVVATFDSTAADTTATTLRRLTAAGSAHAYYRLTSAAGLPSITYTVADRITVLMGAEGASTVDSVLAIGVKDGIHLQPFAAVADSARADTTRGPPPGRPRARPPEGRR